ncbi:MAG TPA: translocation/assembly module TamB domain-containing protein [Daejeonella sp.]|nr:translocation/assembly module TamB domain-containing protein [Daejeonella sp.]
MVAALIVSFQFKSVQTYVAKKAATYLSEELKTRIEIRSLYIKPTSPVLIKTSPNPFDFQLEFVNPFKSIALEGLYVQDLEKDSLLYAPKLTVQFRDISPAKRKIDFRTIQLDQSKFYLKEYKDNSTNLDFIIDYFSGPPQPAKKPSKPPYQITLDKVVLNNIDFKFRNFETDTVIKGINFDDIHLQKLNTTLLNLDTKNHLIKAEVKNLTFREKSGFYLKNLSTHAVIDSNRMEFKNLLLETPKSRISDYFLMKYKTLKDFNNFVKGVYMDAHFNDAHIFASDVAFFASEVRHMSIDIRANGNISGYVNNLKAKQLAIRTGKASYLKGDFQLKGLPNWEKTQLDLNFDQVYSNKADAELILSKITGKKDTVPSIIEKFGNVNFKGRFLGYESDFTATGEFKTALGRIESDVKMKISPKGIHSYAGIVKAYDFDLGNLLDESQVGRTTLKADIQGEGFSLKQLREQIKSDITYLDFKGYRYTNIKVNGGFKDKLFDGRINITDPNIKLDFNGGININPELPVFNFNATLRGANLHALKLTTDTVQVDADFRTNFNGDNLNNIQGDFAIHTIKLTKPDHTFSVDSLSLSAVGVGKNREIKVNSDILDASIKGEYDLNTIPSYFKSVAKTYIPSLNVKHVKPEPQNFVFNLNLKHFEPLSLLFIPELKIPDQAMLSGQFNSANNIANLNGFARTIIYNKIKVNNLIIDQTTTPLALNLFITSDQVDLTDSLYIKNINISNILRNDSLNLNIKLSDKNATNQLDLNGLVEFSKENGATTRLSLLPSDVIINHEVWRIQDKVSFGFEEGKTSIKNFGLFRDNQLLTINGIISKNPEDELLVGFNKFKLTTFNSLTKPLGITLQGELNGNTKLAAIIKNPRIEAGMTIDSLNFNNMPIGNLNLAADFDDATQLVNVKMDIVNKEQKTLDLQGTYNSKNEQNSLDMNVRMEDTELALFQPLLSNLISNVSGKVSTGLRVTGPLTSPQINGNLSLVNAALTVNYLKTPYHFTAKDILVKNSVIHLSNLVLKDTKYNEKDNKNHIAIANGTVDMKDPENPDIHVTVKADNFMALNTTAKNNPLYYGIAYGSGTFKFNGPTDNMSIDIQASTNEGTVFNIPLNSSETVSESDFITFIAKDSTKNIIKKENIFNGVTLKLDLTIDESTEVNIFTDLGKLTGRGTAERLGLRISSFGDFEMSGDYLISSGKFEFTAQENLINKIFEISQGGSIHWSGSPTEATINLKAVYAVRTSLRPLYIAASRPPSDQRVLAEAVMNLNGSLLKPEINFNLNFPADSYLKDELQSYLSDVNNVNQQALSLIVRRSFAPGTGADIQTLGSTLSSAGTELIFNQLNNVIAQNFNLNFVDLNIRSLSEASASFRLLNDRLILTGGVTDRLSKTNNPYLNDFSVLGASAAHDLELQYLLNKNGNLVLRLSNRPNNVDVLNTNTGQYVSAGGLAYRQEFDNLNEFLKTLIGKKRREERRKKELEQQQKEQQPQTNAIIPEEPKVKKK